MERLPDLILEQDPLLPNVADAGHDWFVYCVDAESHVEPSRTDDAYAGREPRHVVRVVCTRAFAETAERIYEEIVRQITNHCRRCTAASEHL